MKLLKDEIYDTILLVARNEFIQRGYKDTSMREIASKADVGLSNIYNYFKNKDDIFKAVVKPAKNDIFTFITQQHTAENINITRISPYGHEEEAVSYFIDLMQKYKEEYRLLLFYSEGSSLCNFRQELTEHMAEISHHYMELEKTYKPNNKEISPFFIHAMSSWMVSVIGEIVTHNLDREHIRKFFHEYFQFTYAGWRELTET